MVRKRIIGVVTIINSKVVQSFGYKKYLPIGSPKSVIQNLDRWGVDEIMIQCIDRSQLLNGPDFEILDQISSMGIGTPIIYSGGIRSVEDAVDVIKKGADRIAFQNILKNFEIIKDISSKLGSQALIASLPLSLKNNSLYLFEYLSRKEEPIRIDLINFLSTNCISEIMIIDWKNDGGNKGFNQDLIENFPIKNKEIILFGGINTSQQINILFKNKVVSALGVGNSLNYKEHAFQKLKNQANLGLLRANTYYSNSSLL